MGTRRHLIRCSNGKDVLLTDHCDAVARRGQRVEIMGDKKHGQIKRLGEITDQEIEPPGRDR